LDILKSLMRRMAQGRRAASSLLSTNEGVERPSAVGARLPPQAPRITPTREKQRAISRIDTPPGSPAQVFINCQRRTVELGDFLRVCNDIRGAGLVLRQTAA